MGKSGKMGRESEGPCFLGRWGNPQYCVVVSDPASRSRGCGRRCEGVRPGSIVPERHGDLAAFSFAVLVRPSKRFPRGQGADSRTGYPHV